MDSIITDDQSSNSTNRCGACGAQDVSLTYRPGLDLFVCLPCNAQPNLGAILIEEFLARFKNRDGS